MDIVFPPRRILCAATLVAVGACTNSGFDMDLRGNLGNAFSTRDAVAQVRTEARPKPDNRGIISYPGYQVAVAQKNDTLPKLAARVGLPVEELAQYNGMPADLTLRRGEILALPRRVAEPSRATGAAVAGPITPVAIAPAENIAVKSLDDNGIQPAGATTPAKPATPTTTSGKEPVRHKVQRGETAYSISRRYGVPTKSLAEWNGLTGDLNLREGQFLLIPVAVPTEAKSTTTSQPGVGSVAPIPPSAAAPLPDEKATAAAPKETPASPEMASQQTKASDTARFAMPATGAIIRAYSKGKNDGIDIAAPVGSDVRAADAGLVAAITRDTDQVPILVLRHDNNILTVYAGVDNITVKKGAKVKRGQTIAKIRAAASPGLYFEVREGFESVDPEPYLN